MLPRRAPGTLGVRAGEAHGAPEGACDRPDAARGDAVADEPLWLAAGALARALASDGVVEVTYLEWTDDGLLRQVVYPGLREDKPAG